MPRFNRSPRALKPLYRFCALPANDMREFIAYGSDIVDHPGFLSMRGYVQHGNTSCFLHSVAVAYYSFALCKRLRVKCDGRSLVRGALLHDYFLYDWHVPGKANRLHGYTHPATALFNASNDFEVNSVEADIIKRHMFPLTLCLPAFRESVIVCIVDKLCSVFEMTRGNPYGFLRSSFARADR